MSQTKNIIIGLSGGVDSAVCAYLLKSQGHSVTAIFMKNWEEKNEDGSCTAELDWEMAERVADHLNIPIEMVNFSDAYWEKVFTYFLDEYKQGRTPNPDILCNKEIKFSAFLNYAKQRGADSIATGHYAKVLEKNSLFYLAEAKDQSKDQTYFLAALNQSQLSQALFPLQDLNKHEVRKIAAEIGLPNHQRKDSTGICFIGEKKFKSFLENYLPAQPGDIRNLDDEVIIGSHHGLMYYTIGQRGGLHIGGLKTYPEVPWYVAKKDLARNILYVVQGEQHPALLSSSLSAKQIHWILGHPPHENANLSARIRYRQTKQPCKLIWDNTEGLTVQFQMPQRAITPGQIIVFYDNEICLGCGVII